MNKTQRNYMIAKAAYETAIQMLIEDAKTIEHLETENEDLFFELYAALEEKHRTSELFKALRKAEDAMITWANKKVARCKHFTPTHKEAQQQIMAQIHMPSVRRKMVDLAFRLA